MRNRPPIISVSLIFCALIAATCAPILVSGYAELNTAELASAAGDYAGAARSYQAAATRLFWRADLWEQAGRAALLADQPQQAVLFLLKAGHLSSRGQLALGQAYLQTDQADLALAAFQASSAQAGASAEAYAGLAQIYRQRGEMDAERSALQNQLLLSPQDAAAQYRLGLLLSLTDVKSALTHLQLASQLDPEYASVVQTLRSALNLADLEPDESTRFEILGRGLGLVGEWALAETAFQNSVQMDAHNAQAWAWLGEAKQHLGRDGRGDLDRALSLDAQNVVVRGLRGLYWKRLGDDRDALTEYQAAAQIEPDNPAWKASLGEIYARLGDLVSALGAYQRAVELAPNESTYWRLLATFCVQYNVQVEEVGLPAAQKAVALTPDDPLALDVLGWAQLSAGQFASAKQTLATALEKAPNFAAAHLHLGLAEIQLGDRNAAYDQFVNAQKLDPQGAYGQQAAQALKQYFP